MKRVVIESPYAGEVAINVAYARRCMLDSLRAGEAPYASHLLFTQEGILDDTKSPERLMGIEAGLVWGEAADLVAVYVERGFSFGMRIGVHRARERGTPIEVRAIDRNVTRDECEYLQELIDGRVVFTVRRVAPSSAPGETNHDG